jgi:hypothetical protein
MFQRQCVSPCGTVHPSPTAVHKASDNRTADYVNEMVSLDSQNHRPHVRGDKCRYTNVAHQVATVAFFHELITWCMTTDRYISRSDQGNQTDPVIVTYCTSLCTAEQHKSCGRCEPHHKDCRNSSLKGVFSHLPLLHSRSFNDVGI